MCAYSGDLTIAVCLVLCWSTVCKYELSWNSSSISSGSLLKDALKDLRG